MSGAVVTWRGPEVKKQLRDAEAIGVQRACEAAAQRAKSSHGWRNRTGALEASIRPTGVERTASGVVGRFGYGKRYGFYLEVGTRGRAGDHTLRRAGDLEGAQLGTYIKRSGKL